MLDRIEALECEKLQQEERNARVIKENRELLDRLEQLNEAVAESDSQVHALSAALHSSEEELQRQTARVAHTESLELQLLKLEKEHELVQHSLEEKVINERTALQRWKRAEKTIVELQDQISMIEQEAKEDRERHAEVVARMERRMAVDAQLAASTARAKAGATRDGGEKVGPSVVTDFVKDILLDNTSLQHGIHELREMLANSNQEVEHLRQQLQNHQPLSPGRINEDDDATPTLQRELGMFEPIINQELHIHHHYHGSAAKKETAPPARAQPNRRSRTKRHPLTAGHFAAPALASASKVIVAQTAVSVPPNSNRWSNATTLAPSSPGSPASPMHRPASINERVFSDTADDSSLPTSPSESNGPGSPNPKSSGCPKPAPRALQPPPIAPLRTVSAPLTFKPKASPTPAIISTISPQGSADLFIYSPSIHPAIPEENEDLSEVNSLASPMFSPTRQPLRRVASHESLISVSGMDIHTLQSRPSQLLYSTSPNFASASAGTSSGAVLTPWTATATPGPLNRSTDSSTLNRNLLYGSLANQRGGIRERRSGGFEGIGKKVGGWVLGKWGATPAKTDIPRPTSGGSASTATTTNSTPLPPAVSSHSSPAPSLKSPSSSSLPKNKDALPVRIRPAGVNQSGPIWGFFDPIPPTPVQVVPATLDEEALRDSLAET